MTTDAKVAFDGVSWALLVGAMPRKEGMERKDLIGVNAQTLRPDGPGARRLRPRVTSASSSSATRATRTA